MRPRERVLLHAEPMVAGGMAGTATDHPDRLRVVSYNIQTGMETSHYGHYLTKSWQHLFPHAERPRNLERIAQMLEGYDLVGLQEVDGGSLRSGFVNQTEFMGRHAGFPYWHDQTNRRIGRLARHSNGMLSRYRPLEIREHKLPGVIPGRGALDMTFGGPGEPLHVVLLHLALGQRSRARQLDYVASFVRRYRHVIVMGDLNCLADADELVRFRDASGLMEPAHEEPSYPSWRPQRTIDHIMVSPTLEVEHAGVLDYPLSDHLPVYMEIRLPAEVQLIG